MSNSVNMIIIEVIVRQSRAAKNYWSWLIEKYKANPEPMITGREQTRRLAIESKEKGSSLFKVVSLIENYSLYKSLLCTIL